MRKGGKALPALEVWFPFLEERANAFLVVMAVVDLSAQTSEAARRSRGSRDETSDRTRSSSFMSATHNGDVSAI